MKQEILSLLSGESFMDYLKGVELFKTALKDGAIKEEDIDHELMERVCAIMAMERWVDHEDYEDRLGYYMDELSENHTALIQDENINHHLKGIALFINSLAEHDYDVSGFLYASHSGYLMSHTAAESVAEYLSAKEELEGSVLFKDMSAFFGLINTAQFSLVSALMDIKNWTVPMSNGFMNILTASQVYFQSWMLSSLYQVVNDPIIKTNIFDEYLKILNEVKTKFVEEKNEEALEDINYVIGMVEERAAGK